MKLYSINIQTAHNSMVGVIFTDIYAFLRKALAKGPDSDLVHRGPARLHGNYAILSGIFGVISAILFWILLIIVI